MTEGGAPGPPTSCWFCRSASGTTALSELVIYQDDLFLATHALEPEGRTYLGSVTVQTKRHVHDLGSLSDPESQRVGPLLTQLGRSLQKCTGAEWTYCALFLEGFRHVHFILTARYPSVPPEFLRLDIERWPGAPRGSREQVLDLVRRIRASMHPIR